MDGDDKIKRYRVAPGMYRVSVSGSADRLGAMREQARRSMERIRSGGQAMSDETLNDVLARLGWRRGDRVDYHRFAIYDDADEHVGDYTADELWRVLRREGLIQ